MPSNIVLTENETGCLVSFSFHLLEGRYFPSKLIVSLSQKEDFFPTITPLPPFYVIS